MDMLSAQKGRIAGSAFEGIESNNDEISKETLLDFVKMFLVEYPADDTDVGEERLYCWYD